MNFNKSLGNLALRVLLVFVLTNSLPCISSLMAQEFQEKKSLDIETCESPTKRKILKTLDDISFKANVDLISILFHGLSGLLRGGYELIVGPSFEGNLITRDDHYYFSIGHDFLIGQLKTKIPIYFGVNADASVEAEFSRQFDDPCLANRLDARYGENEVPFKAETVLNKLKIGDYFTMKTHWALAPGMGVSKGLVLTVSAGGHEIMSGDFQFHFLKESETKVRIKVVGLKSAGHGWTALNVGLFKGRNFVPVGIINGQLHRIMDNIFDLSFMHEADNVIMTEMIVDLSDEATRKAYDQMLAFTTENQEAFNDLLHVETLKVLKQDFNQQVAAHLKPGVFINLDPLHSLARKHSPFVTESFRSTDLIDADRAPKMAGLNFVAGGRGTAESEHHKIAVLNANDKERNFQIDSFHSKSELVSDLNYKGEISDQSLHLLCSSDSQFKRNSYVELVANVELRKKIFMPDDLAQVKRVAMRSMPANIYEQIQNEISAHWKNFDREHKKVHSLLQVALHENALKALPQINEGDLKQAFEDYLKSVDLSGDEIFKVLLSGEAITEYWAMAAPEQNRYARSRLAWDIKEIVTLLTKAMDQSMSLDSRADAFSALQNISLFIHVGSGFMLSLLPQDQLKNLIKINFVLEDSEGSRAVLVFGDKPINPLYVEVLKIQSILNDSGKDLKLEGIKLVTLPGAQTNPGSLTAPEITAK